MGWAAFWAAFLQTRPITLCFTRIVRYEEQKATTIRQKKFCLNLWPATREATQGGQIWLIFAPWASD
jgi:hypothetical protein